MIQGKDRPISWTYHEDFDRDGYFVIKKLCDPVLLKDDIPSEGHGKLRIYNKDMTITELPETQVSGSIARRNLPQYSEIFSEIKKVLEQQLGRKLYFTYYYDRFYFVGQELTPHVDKPVCEISVSVHISSNTENPWPFKLKTLSGEEKSIILDPGDAIVYKGVEVQHWRDKLTSKYNKDDAYYHQIFFHYVLQDGEYVQLVNLLI